eukprot:469432-Amphidinium_carterae.1
MQRLWLSSTSLDYHTKRGIVDHLLLILKRLYPLSARTDRGMIRPGDLRSKRQKKESSHHSDTVNHEIPPVEKMVHPNVLFAGMSREAH